uniref:Uncharacterized protein n=1 Tax=Nicotiana tabacum TaxID=4097 RepID=A0A1S3Z3I2_TOBAC|nr:PREDICTED: uncharacterized protein LOC107782370 [Nicotiana tabacum]
MAYSRRSQATMARLRFGQQGDNSLKLAQKGVKHAQYKSKHSVTGPMRPHSILCGPQRGSSERCSFQTFKQCSRKAFHTDHIGFIAAAFDSVRSAKLRFREFPI